MHRPPFLAISLLSVCVLSYEVLLTRLFSIVMWHHFAYMIISAAMLGYGASGTALTLLKEKLTTHFGIVYVMSASALAVLMPVAFWLSQQVPFDPLELLWDQSQPVKLSVIYLLMMLPFFFGGLSIGLIFSCFGKQSSRIYAFDILGAGIGSLGVIIALFVLPPQRMLGALSSLAFIAAAIAVIELKIREKWLLEILFGLAILAAALPSMELHPSPYKDLSQSLNIVGAKVIEELSSPLGQVTVVENNRVPLRDAPGMSLNASMEPPPQLGVYFDGDGPSALTRFDGNLAPLGYLDQLTSALPYHVHDTNETHYGDDWPASVLILGAGAGSDVLQSLYQGSTVIDAVELDRNIINLVRERFRDYSGNLYNLPGVRIHKAEARGFVNSSAVRYDLIQVSLLDSFGTTSAGLYGLSESYLYTVEALQTYLDCLKSDGLLAITRWLTLPPRDALKLFATAVTALERTGVNDPATRLVMIRGWKTVTLLVKNRAFTAAEITSIREFCRIRSFDLVYYPGMQSKEANRYNLLEKPEFYEGATAILGTQRQDFIEQYKFYIEPASDDRPFFFRFFKWNAVAEIFSLREQGGMALLDWSYPLLVATLIQAIAASFVLILLPLGFSRCRKTLPGKSATLYFLAIGFAFMFMEIAFIQKFILFLSHPLYSVAVVLCAFLLFASAGSWLAGRSGVANKVTLAVIALCAISLLYLAMLPSVFQMLIHLPDLMKILISVALIAPLAICMGVPYPAGMTQLATLSEQAIPWAWAINGFASVVGAVLATLLAIHLGFGVVIFLASMMYALASVALKGFA